MSLRAGYVLAGNDYLHRVIVEKAIGRKLTGKEKVHHVDFNKLNNTPSNLVLCPDQSYHLLLHARSNIVFAGGNADKEAVCTGCNKIRDKGEFPKNPNRWNGISTYCKDCSNKYRRAKAYHKKEDSWKPCLRQQYYVIRSGKLQREICWLYD
jgi:hypothetical protein